jgi:hypothetical protein
MVANSDFGIVTSYPIAHYQIIMGVTANIASISKLKSPAAWQNILNGQIIYKPGFVSGCPEAGHLSRRAVASELKRFL